MKKLLPLLFIILVLYGCTDCGPQQELSVRIRFDRTKDSLYLNQIQAIGALDQKVFKEQTEYFNKYQEFSFTGLPISLLADSTTYVFNFNNRTDTLTLFYQRDFYYKENCGFVVDTKRPAKLQETISTFSQVRAEYESYIMEEVTLKGGIGGQGISLNITL
ncbi:hypothetical protein L0657_19510 [Dyadobacter sp. CY345]|uniref:hypothetical protein n=1 Tax=Dyadobacter sp. CY345 TaxID=2909335 RepID=UPI001F34ECCC|nr:hypothetical protein [Dyadobacter sp. CY345]MCF2446154.1 hypothetical protein [Dyadobacter sp. CY345]